MLGGHRRAQGLPVPAGLEKQLTEDHPFVREHLGASFLHEQEATPDWLPENKEAPSSSEPAAETPEEAAAREKKWALEKLAKFSSGGA